MEKNNVFDTYLESQSEEGKQMLIHLRTIFHNTIPGIKESMSYGVPAFDLKPNAKMKDKIMIAGFKKHVGLYPHPDTIEAFKDRLTPYIISKGTVQIQYHQEIPDELIKDMIVYRYKEVNRNIK